MKERALERAKIGDVELEYEVSGSGEPAIFIHGAFIADAFQPVIAEPGLAGRYQVIHYHRRGYMGSSRTTGPCDITQQAVDCFELLRYLGVQRAHVVGHSYGGSVALQLALDAPELVHSLALLEPGLMVGTSAQGYRESLLRSVERYREAGAAVSVDEFLQARLPGYRPLLDRILPGAFDQAVADAATTFECELLGQPNWSFGEAETCRISQPTLSLLDGESEALWPRFGEAHRLLLSWMPNAEGSIVPDARHLMHLEYPMVVAHALLGFWSHHPLATAAA